MSQDRSKLRWNGWGWVARKDELAARDDVWAWLASQLGMPALLATPARALDGLAIADSALAPSHRAELIAIVGESQVRDDLTERAFHARGRSYRDLLHLRAGDLSDAPDAVVYPRGTDEVLAILSLAAQRRIAVIPFGAGTALQRGAASLRGECESVITLDLSDMDRIIAIDGVSLTAEVEAGIYGSALESALKAKGLTLDQAAPTSEFSTLGGWIATDGVTPQEWLINAKLATPTGLLDTAHNGFDLSHLMRGSEGQFGIITEATIRLKPLPKDRQACAYLLGDFSTGLAALRALHQDGCWPAKLCVTDVEETRFFADFDRIGEAQSVAERLKAHYRQWRGTGVSPCRMVALFEGDDLSQQRRRFDRAIKRYGAVRLNSTDKVAVRETGGYLRDSLLERAVGVETLTVTARWTKLHNVYATTRAALEMVLRETAPREGAQGVVLCRVPEATAWGATLTFTAVFPRDLGAELEQADKIVAAAYLAMQASGGVSHRNAGPIDERAVAVCCAIQGTLDPKGVLAHGAKRF